MKKINSNKRLIYSLTKPIIISSFVLLILYFISWLPLEFEIKEYSLLSFMCCALCFYPASFITEDKDKGVVVSMSLFVLDFLHYLNSEHALGIVFIIGACVGLSFLVKRFSFYESIAVCTMLSVILFVLLFVLDNFLLNLSISIATKTKLFPQLFGAENNLFKLLFSDRLEYLVYHTNTNAAQIINNKLAKGVVDIFALTRDNPSSLVSKYLAGDYIANVFVSLGIFLSCYKRAKDKYLLPLALATALSIFCGNSLLLCAFILFYNPFLYLGFLVCSVLSHIVVSLVDIRIGFTNSASVVEAFCYMDKLLYFFIIGFIFVAISYFICEFVFSKWNFEEHRFLPRDIRHLVLSLGGEDNIENISNGKLYVYNPNIVDELAIDCEIVQNEIKLNKEDFESLLKYY